MEKRKLKLYATKNIFIAYITTVNPDSYTIEGQVTKSVLAVKKEMGNKSTNVLVPIDTYFPYYSIDKVCPISTKMNRVTAFITKEEIDFIIEKEKKHPTLETPISDSIKSYPSEKDNREREFVNSLEIGTESCKVKKLVA